MCSEQECMQAMDRYADMVRRICLVHLKKHPKSSRYGRQNPITARWNSEDQLIAWREAWADMTNRAIEQAGLEERIDHRSHAVRGIDEQPTIL